jgi:hypothetical protein
MTTAERSSEQNGIWLCQTCSRVIDVDVESYPAAALNAMKRAAELRATRATYAAGEITEIIAIVDCLIAALNTFTFTVDAEFLESTLAEDRATRRLEGAAWEEAWDEYGRMITRLSDAVREKYFRDVTPLVSALTARLRPVLRDEDERKQFEREVLFAQTNQLGRKGFVEYLYQLRVLLELRSQRARRTRKRVTTIGSASPGSTGPAAGGKRPCGGER